MPSSTKTDCHPFRSAEARERYLAFYETQAAKWPVRSETRVVQTDDFGETFVRMELVRFMVRHWYFCLLVEPPPCVGRRW